MIVMHMGGTPFLFDYFGVFSACLSQPVLPLQYPGFLVLAQGIKMDTPIRNCEI